MNAHDSERIAGLFEADGMQETSSLDEADVVVLNTCCIRENADNKLYGTLGHLKSLKAARPGMEIVVGGCLAQKDRDLIRERAGHVDVVFGTHNVSRAVELLHASRANGPITEIWEETVLDEADAFPSAMAAKRDVDCSAWVTIQIGCDNSCAFCIVPSVRGREISRPFGDLVDEVERLVADGVVEVTLLGQNVNAYGLDLRRGGRAEAPGFPALLRALDGTPGLARIRFMTSHPKDLSDELIDAIRELPAVCEHVHLPVQAGSDRILAAMRRGYSADAYLERVRTLRAAVPEVSITSDLIAGFPGETEHDFQQTLGLVRAAALDGAFTFIFSAREGTAAAALEDHVSREVRVDRVERLVALTQELGLAAHRRWVGRAAEVLIEGTSRDGRLLRGRTRQNVTVNVSGAAEPGAIVRVEITGATSTTLRGRL